jgi:DNA-binding response OmpR family regulator
MRENRTQRNVGGAGDDKPTVLVVEDEALVREVTCEVLKTAGFEVLQAATAKEARRELQLRHVDVLICDSVLPDESGALLAQEGFRQNAGLKVLFASGYPKNNIANRDVLPAQAHFIAKPFGAASLIAHVRALLSEKETLALAAGHLG